MPKYKNVIEPILASKIDPGWRFVTNPPAVNCLKSVHWITNSHLATKLSTSPEWAADTTRGSVSSRLVYWTVQWEWDPIIKTSCKKRAMWTNIVEWISDTYNSKNVNWHSDHHRAGDAWESWGSFPVPSCTSWSWEPARSTGQWRCLPPVNLGQQGRGRHGHSLLLEVRHGAGNHLALQSDLLAAVGTPGRRHSSFLVIWKEINQD